MEQKQINLLILGVIVVLIFGVFNYLISPKYQEITLKNNEIEMLEKQIKSINDYYLFAEDNFKKLKDAGWDNKRKIIESNFTSSPFFFPKVHYFLRTISSENGMIVSNITNSNPIEISKTQDEYRDKLEGPVKKTTFNLSLTGNYSSLRSLLSSLERQARVVTVRSVSILPLSKQSEDMPSDFFDFNLSVDLYSY
jgi:hypothetical protein